MKQMFLVIVFFMCILHLNGAKQMNVAVTLHRNDIFSLFSEDQIWGIQYKNKTEDIVQLNVVIDETEKSKLKKDMIIEFDIIYPDIDIPLRKERERLNNRTKWTRDMKPDIFFQAYRDWIEYVLFLDTLLIRYSNLLSRSYLSTPTIQGRQIPVFTLSTNDESKPGLYIQAEVHCREWLANAACMYILNGLLEGYGTDEAITNILNAINIYIVPTVNIDGYIYTWIDSDNRMWRKNRRQNYDDSFGVDLNRNYDGPEGTWGPPGSSTNPPSNTYCGTAPYSEPEIQSVRDYIFGNPTYNIRAGVDMHTSGPLILYPWAHTTDPVPQPYYDQYVALAQNISDAIFNVHGVEYVPTQFLGQSSGTFRDYPFGVTEPGNKIYSFTWEGRGPGFDPPPSNIIPAGQEQLAGMLALARFVMTLD